MKITLSGLPYSGKGVLGKKLAEILMIPYFSVGDLRREYAQKQGITIEKLNELSEKDSQWDKRADEYQVEWAKKQERFLLEGRLSYHFIPDSLKLFLTVSPEEAARRALLANRDSEKKAETLEAQINKNEERCQSDVRRYLALYGIENCYNQRNFEVVVDTTDLTPEEVLQRALTGVRIRKEKDKFL